MRIACVTSPDPGRTDLVLAGIAARLLAGGWRLAGAVQVNTDCAGRNRCDMDLQVLPDGPAIRISQNLGADSQGCRLDAGALETAVAEVARRMAGPVELLILNKFGKHEAEGRGFRGLIGEALARGIPVLTGVNTLNRAAFDAFAEGMAEPLEADPEAILAWAEGLRAAA